MRMCVLLCLWLTAIKVDAQLEYTPLTISNDGNFSSFPLFSSKTQPKVAATINKVLQMICFNHVNIEKNPAAYADKEAFSSWNYSVDYWNDHMLQVRITHFFPKQSMHTYDRTEYTNVWFDTATGDRVFPLNFITTDGMARMKEQQKEQAPAIIRKQVAILQKKYSGKEYMDALPSVNETLSSINNDIDKNTTGPVINNSFNGVDKAFTFVYYWHDGDPEGIHELLEGFKIQVVAEDLKTYTTASWSYYMGAGGSIAPDVDPISHIWSGIIGGKTPVTIMISRAGGNFSGKEVYDNYGATINLSVETTGNTFFINELDENGIKVAYYQVTLANGKLTGIWQKANGTRTADFKATIGGTP